MQDYKSEEDEALVRLAQSGDGRATEELLKRYKNFVRSRARKYFLTGFETDDLVQEGMIGLCDAVARFREDAETPFAGFAGLCVDRRLVDALRSAGRSVSETAEPFDPDTLAEGGTPEDFVLDWEDRAEFRLRLMGALSDFEFRVVTCYLDGMSYAQISAATGKDFKSIDNALARAKRKLSRAYRQDKTNRA